MSTDVQGTLWRTNIAENFNRLSRVHQRYRRQTDRRQTDGRWHIANVNVSSRSLKTNVQYDSTCLWRSRKMSDSSPKNMKITLGLMISTNRLSRVKSTTNVANKRCIIRPDSCVGVIEIETVRQQCRSVRKTLRHWCRTVRTLRHQFDSAEMSWVRSVLGPKCLDTVLTTELT